MVYGLRIDFVGKLFEGFKEFLVIVDKFIELKVVCYCGKKVIMIV